MKTKIIFFIFMLAVIATACNETIIPEEIVPVPEVSLTVLPQGPVSPGDLVTVGCEAKYATQTNNNIGAPTTISWSYSFAVKEALVVSVTAIGENGQSVTKEQKVEVIVPPVIISSVIDSIITTPWIEEGSYLSFDNGANWSKETFPEKYTNMKLVFKANKTYDLFFSDGNYNTTDKWSVEGRKMNIFGDWKNFSLTAKTLIFTFNGTKVDSHGVEAKILCKIIYNRI